MRRSQAQWEAYCTDRLPPDIAKAVLADARALHGVPDPASSSPWYTQNQRLAGHRRGFRASRISQAYDERAIRDFAENYATAARRIEPASEHLADQLRCLERRQLYAQALGVEPPADLNYTIHGRLKRLENPLWWRRCLRRTWTRGAETRCRGIGLIRRGVQPYVTDTAVRHRENQYITGLQFLRTRVLVNELNEQIPLFDVVEGSIANPEIRRGELMTRARGFEEVATCIGHECLFVTLTCPSAFHPQLAAGGANPRYQNFTIQEGQQWLSRQWARARAWLKRKGVKVYGFRVAEPHHDGTPHWHVLLYGQSAALARVEHCLAHFWLGEFADEPGAREHRVEFKRIDPAQGSGVGYIAKYISKNIDARGQIANANDTETGTDIPGNVARVRAWASVHGIRQFQQIGGPPVGIWREARKLREGADDPDISAVVEAADRGDWCRFVFNVGGIHVGRRTNIRLRKEETGSANQYGELNPPQVVGLQYASAIVITRPHRWRIEKCPSLLSLDSSPPFQPQRDFEAATALACSADSKFGPTITTLMQLQQCLSISSATNRRLSDSDSGSGSYLGPVAITVRDGRFAVPEYDESGLLVWRWYRRNDPVEEDSS